MTPRYEWTPASEPPSDSRPVLLLLASGDWHKGFHTTGAHPSWWIDRCNLPIGNVTHWRDVALPDVPEIGFGNMAGGE